MNRCHLITRLITLLITLSGVVAGPAAVAANQPLQEVMVEKIIEIRPAGAFAQPTPTTTTTTVQQPAPVKPLQVRLTTDRARYQPGEKIGFQVSGNKDFYLYLFNIDTRTGQAVMLLPNRFQTNLNIKYPGDGKPRLVPNRSVEFYADQAGLERIMMVASERYLDVNDLMSHGQSKSLGDFYALETPFKALNRAITETYADALIGNKSIHIRQPDSSRLPKGVLVEEFNLTIEP